MRLSANAHLVHTGRQSNAIDLARPWQIIPAAKNKTQSAIGRATGLLLKQPNHPLMTSSTHGLHFTTATNLKNQVCHSDPGRNLMHLSLTSPLIWLQRLPAASFFRDQTAVITHKWAEHSVIMNTRDVTHEQHNQVTGSDTGSPFDIEMSRRPSHGTTDTVLRCR